jgi:hypothetical protein
MVIGCKYTFSLHEKLSDYGVAFSFMIYGAQIIFSYHYDKTIYAGYSVLDPEADDGLRTVSALFGYVVLITSPLFV